MKKPPLIRDDSDERQGWWLGDRFVPDGGEPDRVYDLKPVPTEALLAELDARGISWDDLPWEDCGECAHIRGFNERTGKCGAARKPVFLDYSDPHKVGFYAIQCPRRDVVSGVQGREP